MRLNAKGVVSWGSALVLILMLTIVGCQPPGVR